MKVHPLSLFTSLILCWNTTAHAEGRLAEFYTLALLNDPQLRIAEQRLAQAEASTEVVFGKLLPQINASAQLSGTDYSSEVTSYRYTGERYNINLSQALFDLSALSDLERAEWEEELQRLSNEHNLQERTAVFVERYFETLRQQRLLDISNAELSVLNKNLERVDSLFNKQLVSIVDRLDAVARRDQLVAEIARQQADYAFAQEMLAESVGEAAFAPLAPFELKAEKVNDKLETIDYWQDSALKQSPLLQANEAKLKAAEASLARAENDRLPKLSLRLSSQYTNVGSEYSQTSFNNANVISLNVTAPLYLGGSDHARVSAQESIVEETRHEIEMDVLRIKREIRAAFQSTRANLSAQKAAKAALESATEARKAAEKSFNFGITDVVTLMERSSAEFNAAQQLADTQYQTVTSYVNLLRWSGALEAEDIHLLDEMIL